MTDTLFGIASVCPVVGTSFWYAYRRLPAPRGDTCAAENSKGLRRIVWTSALIVLVIDAASFVPQSLS